MKHTNHTAFARPETAVQNESGLIDKWDILSALTAAAESFRLNHRTLGVLKALMSFLPSRLISAEVRSAVVFPSNRTLSNRLNGMPDSTLRRHLATLVTAGIVSRHDSANRKRFARRVGQQRELAFGFDLSPLARHSADILKQADKARHLNEQLAATRAQVAHLRQVVITRIGAHDLVDCAQRVLRRKPNAADLIEMQQQLETAIDAFGSSKMSRTDGQNERHIQYEDIIISDSETAPSDKADEVKQCTADNNAPKLSEITEVCKEYKTYFPEPVRHWHDLAHIADQLSPMMGIDRQVFKDAISKMGLPCAVTTVLCILERLADIRNPGGYLRRLTQTARAGGFDVRPMLDAVLQRRELSPDNQGNYIKSMCYL